MASQGLRNLGRSGLRVSPLCLGAMNFGNEQFGCDEKTSIGIIHAYLDAGHNFIDTANVYSGTKSETIVGKAVKDRRDAVVIATKAASPLGPGPFDSGSSRKHVVKACEDSLRRLGTDYIDLYQMHRYDDATPLEETLSTLNDLVRQGKVRYIGVSNWTASQIVEACLTIDAKGWEPLVSLQPQYSILARDIEVEILPACRKFGLGVIPWSPLAAACSPASTSRARSRKRARDSRRPVRSSACGDALAERAQPRNRLVGARRGRQTQRLADRAGAGVEPGAAGDRLADHRSEDGAAAEGQSGGARSRASSRCHRADRRGQRTLLALSARLHADGAPIDGDDGPAELSSEELGNLCTG